uniref:VWFA domain-containing protein n=1 Tax=Panagrolaimus sp. JU765 TaxID=591449 RepID=A0AC34RTI5_9BILA
METTTVGTTSTITTPISVCHSLIPFSFDVATDLTAADFADLKTFLVNPFLSELFPLDVQPAVFSTYDNASHGYDRPINVSDIATTVQNLSQTNATTSDFIQPLQYFVDQGVSTLGSTNGLAVNTVIFAGSPLNDSDTANFLGTPFTTNGNTLTVVLVNPDINQTNYRNVTGLNIVVWSDPATTLVAIKNVMNCQPLSTTVTTTPNPTTTTQTTTAAPTTSTLMTTTTTFPRPIDIAVVMDGSTCSSGIGNLNSQLAVLEKIFHEYTFGLNVRVAFANPISIDFQTMFVCDMASINTAIQSINLYCEETILDDQQRLNDSMVESMNALYDKNSPALVFLVLLQSNGTIYTNETDSVFNATIEFRESCLEPTNAKVAVVQVDSFYPVDPALASDGFFFTNTEDIGTRVAEAFENINDYNAAAYTCTCAPSGQNFASDPACYPNS